MKAFKITITETAICTVEVEAETLEEAREMVEREYWKNPSEYTFNSYDTSFE